VGLVLPGSAEMIVVSLAVWKAGGACLVLDPDHPAERLAYMLGDTRSVCVITTGRLAGRLPNSCATPHVVLDDLDARGARDVLGQRSHRR
jgi:non-ribosomal peptide synthetase component F